MLSTRPRRSTSAASYSEDSANKISQQLDLLKASHGDSLAITGHRQLSSLQLLRQLLDNDAQDNHVRDAFRHLHGFESLLDYMKRSIAQYTDSENDSIRDIACKNVAETFRLLEHALRDHWGNCRFFSKRVGNGGWRSILELSQEAVKNARSGCQQLAIQILASLHSLAFGTADWSTLYTQSESESATLDDLKKKLADKSKLANPEALYLLTQLWSDVVLTDTALSVFVQTFPLVLRGACELSIHALHTLHSTQIPGLVLRHLDDCPERFDHLKFVAASLLRLGVPTTEDAFYMYSRVTASSPIASLLCGALKADPLPPHIHFDLSAEGFSSIELPDIRKQFPPPSSSAGYTLSLWLNIVHYDPSNHTTIFGAFDASQTCFVLVYLERDTHNLILQTSINSSRPSVRFKSVAFETSRWYHIAIVHRRPKSASSARASLYVDGEFAEQVKIQFPDNPAPPSAGRWSINDPNASQRQRPIQAFLGTPADLAARKGSNVAASQWKLASAHLYGTALTDELIAVHRELGPRYFGNYQDCLGSFQTYETSAALNLRNDTLHPGKEEDSEIVAATRSKASNLVPESQILLSLSPMFVIDDDEGRDFDGSQLAHSLSRTSQHHLRQLSRGGRTPVILNGSVASVGTALAGGVNAAIMTGTSSIITPEGLDEAAFNIHGCIGVGLSLIEMADDADTFCQALEILFGTIKHSWRNSEAMERENGYGILSILLETKLRKLAVFRPPTVAVLQEEDSDDDFRGAGLSTKDIVYRALELLLDFVGFRKDCPEDSVICNPLAYRVLLVDMDIWRLASTEVQKLYYSQFVTFIKGSKHHLFNAKRLARMRIIRKWLDVLKGEPFYLPTLPYFTDAFGQIFSVAPASDSMRSLALFIAYGLETRSKPSTHGLRHSRSIKFSTGFGPPARRSTAPVNSGQSLTQPSAGPLDSQQLGRAMLKMYADLLCQEEASVARKFARSVSSRWMLNLVGDDDQSVVVQGCRILARILLVNGQGYIDKFCSEKTGGPTIMKNFLRRQWTTPALWISLLGIFFGRDLSKINVDQPFDIAHLLMTFPVAELRVAIPEFLPVLMAALQHGIKSATRETQADAAPTSPTKAKENQRPMPSSSLDERSRSVSLATPLQPLRVQTQTPQQRRSDIIATVIRFLSNVHLNSQPFRDFCLSAPFVQEFVFMLYPLIVSSDVVSPEVELNSKDSALTFHGEDVVIRPVSQRSTGGASIVRTLPVETGSSPNSGSAFQARPLRRTSSYVLVTSFDSADDPVTPQLSTPFSPKKGKRPPLPHINNRLVEEVLELIIAVFTDQLITRKDFAGIGLYKRLPPGFQEHQAYFASFILRNALTHLSNAFRLNQDQFLDARILTNLARFAIHLREAVFEGWFIDGAEPVLEFLGAILEHLQRPEVAKVKSVRLCTEQIASVRWAVERVVLLRLSEIDTSQDHQRTVALLTKITYWHGVLFHESSQHQFMKLFFYLLYTKVVSHNKTVAVKAADLCRILLLQQEDWQDVILEGVREGKSELAEAFGKIQELDNDAFLAWLTQHRENLDRAMFDHPAVLWEDFVKAENRRTEDSAKERITRRRERLREWAKDDSQTDEVIRKHEASAGPWRANIYRQEHDKRLKSLQDEQDNRLFNVASWKKLRASLARPAGFLDDGQGPAGWQLDRTEGPNRMRIRMIPDTHALAHNYQGKEAAAKGKELSLDIRQALKSKIPEGMPSPASAMHSPMPNTPNGQTETKDASTAAPNPGNGLPGEEDEFEMVEDMNDGVEGFEDKNRKVMRSLQRGDRVEHVCNAARIIGLEAVEAILIVGKHHLYMIDNYFVREDAEIVNIWHAPQDERDSYLQLISGRQAKDHQVKPIDATHETKHWRWEDVLSISKRRFLFREVGIEIFFVDGQGFLLTMKKPKSRDELHSRLFSKAQSSAGGLATTRTEDAWRLELLRTPEDAPQSLGQSFGSKFSNVFNNSSSNVATRKWMKGELSNFNYLMLINTMAGRTFNDLTQYPVFPWVLADYTSDELDLTNPRSFRDLTKPMGCQTAEREAEFRERYKQFAEMGDSGAPPFHYGTHYSSAMIVTSYLVRLQPFVHSYLLLQGGNFDHPDRMFYSIEKAWNSASRDNMSDVRELTPEFFYLPELFTNTNGYDFGTRQGAGGRIDNVALPPWAKGDPKIFVAKNREALESEFVSKRLHAWIDLVFGHKQSGEAALEATNVFHHLSYRGSKNLDDIHDPVERLSTIGIIHNFGQTPHQVFRRTHPLREDMRNRVKKLDSLAEFLTRLPFPVLEAPERIAHILWDAKREKLVCSGALKVNAPPFYDKYLEWGLVDGGIRFHNADNHRLVGLFEHVHQTQINACMFVDSRTLVTAGLDCVVSVWSVVGGSKTVDLNLKTSFFGHRKPVNTVAASPAFSTLLTADESGAVLTWDLNRLELVRVLIPAGTGPRVDCAAIDHVNGMILLCRGPTVAVYTLNGELLADQHISTELDDVISTCAFYENNPAEYSARTLFFTGHKRGVANAWSVGIVGGRWALTHVKRMNHAEEHSGVNVSAAITAILPRALKVYTGDEDGRVYEWDCVQHG